MAKRIIKFRIWNLATKKMLPPSDIGTMPTDTSQSILGENTGSIYLEWTGLKDKNGKEIFEGDIVEAGFKRSVYEIVWFENNLRWAGKQKNRMFGLYALVKPNIIGNIMENPELLK